MKNLFIILTFFFCLSSHASSISDIAANVNSSQKAVQDFFDGKSGFETTFDIVQRTYLQALKFSNQADSKEEIAEAVKYREHASYLLYLLELSQADMPLLLRILDEKDSLIIRD